MSVGGIMTSLGEFAGKAVEKFSGEEAAGAAESVASREPGAWAKTARFISPSQDVLSQSQAGKTILQLKDLYLKTGAEIHGKYMRDINLAGKARDAGKLKEALGAAADFHTNVKAAGKEGNLTKTPLTAETIESQHIRSAAYTHARRQVYGEHDEVVMALQKAMYDEKGPGARQWSHDFHNQLFHDSAYKTESAEGVKYGSTLDRNVAVKKIAGEATPARPARTIVNKAGKTVNYKAVAAKPGTPEANAIKAVQYNPAYVSKYMKASPTEQHTMGVAAAVFANVAGLLHFSQPAFMAVTDTLPRIGKVLATLAPFTESRASTLKMLDDFGALNEIHITEAEAFMKARNNLFYNWMPGSMGEIIYRNISMPAITMSRHMNLVWAGTAAKFSVQEAAGDIMSQEANKVRLAGIELRHHGLNPEEIIAQGGKLTPEQMQTAIWHGMKERVGVRNDVALRNLYIRNTAPGRIISIFHNYSLQSRTILGNALRKQFVEKGFSSNPGSCIQSIAALAAVIPEVGNAFKMLSDTAHGKDEEQGDSPLKHWETREKDMWDFSNPGRAMATRIDNAAHLAGLGMLTNSVSGAFHYHLLDSAAGPITGSIAEHLMDLLHAASGKSAKPLERDILGDIPLVGKPLAHALVPNKPKHTSIKMHTKKASESWWEHIAPRD